MIEEREIRIFNTKLIYLPGDPLDGHQVTTRAFATLIFFSMLILFSTRRQHKDILAQVLYSTP